MKQIDTCAQFYLRSSDGFVSKATTDSKFIYVPDKALAGLFRLHTMLTSCEEISASDQYFLSEAGNAVHANMRSNCANLTIGATEPEWYVKGELHKNSHVKLRLVNSVIPGEFYIGNCKNVLSLVRGEDAASNFEMVTHTEQPPPENENKIRGWMIAGIVIGAVALLIFVIVVIWLTRKHMSDRSTLAPARSLAPPLYPLGTEIPGIPGISSPTGVY
jgi:hypothetical protein